MILSLVGCDAVICIKFNKTKLQNLNETPEEIKII